MANFKVVISDPSSKKAYQKEADQTQAGLLGKKIGEKVSGSGIGLEGYELEITGGSDNDGFPMRKDVDGTARKKIILTSPPGYHPKHSGNRKRKSVRGNTVSQDISQINVKVVKAGSKKLDQLLGKKAEGKAEAKEDGKKEGEAKETKPEAEKAESKKEEAKAEKPVESKPEEKSEAAEEKGSPSQSDQAAKAESKMGVKPIDKAEADAKKEDK